MELPFVHEQNHGVLGDRPVLFHRPDNEAQMMYEEDGSLVCIVGETPESMWGDVQFGAPILYERYAENRTLLALAYESAYNGIFLWIGDVDGAMRTDMALLLDILAAEYIADTERYSIFEWLWQCTPEQAMSWQCTEAQTASWQPMGKPGYLIPTVIPPKPNRGLDDNGEGEGGSE